MIVSDESQFCLPTIDKCLCMQHKSGECSRVYLFITHGLNPWHHRVSYHKLQLSLALGICEWNCRLYNRCSKHYSIHSATIPACMWNDETILDSFTWPTYNSYCIVSTVVRSMVYDIAVWYSSSVWSYQNESKGLY